MRIVLTIEYDGTHYCGWQVQKNGVSIQQKLNEALLALTGEHTWPHASGRTDAGVHALAQVAHFDTQSGIPPEKFALALNTVLPPDIRILRSRAAHPQSFHARFDARGKHYRYIIKTGPAASALGRSRCCHVPVELDLDRMRRAARHIEGTHDFAAFCAAGSNTKGTTVRTVRRIDIAQDGEYITIDVMGDGFLYNMVRIIAGTLIAVGKGKLAPDDVAGIIDGKKRARAGATAPPHGLYLVEVYYDE